MRTGLTQPGGHQERPAEEHLPTLDGWRALAILLVLVCHGLSTIFLPEGLYPSPRLGDFAVRAAVGVQIFFGLSGLLICSRLLREESRAGRINLRAFYIKRCFRILPLYMAYLLVVAALHFLTGEFNLNRAEWSSCLLFWRNYLPASLRSADRWYFGHFWSLSVEEQFYVLWPTLLFLLHRQRARTAAIILASLNLLWRVFRQDWQVDPTMDGLLWGCVLAITLAEAPGREILRRVLTPWLWAGLLMLAMVANFRNWHSAPVWLPLCIPFLIAGTLLNPDWLVSRWLENPVLRWIGRISYGLYVWQQLLLIGSHPRVAALGIAQVFPFNILFLFLIASLSYYLFERPVLAFGHRLAAQTRRSNPPLAAATTP